MKFVIEKSKKLGIFENIKYSFPIKNYIGNEKLKNDYFDNKINYSHLKSTIIMNKNNEINFNIIKFNDDNASIHSSNSEINQNNGKNNYVFIKTIEKKNNENLGFLNNPFNRKKSKK